MTTKGIDHNKSVVYCWAELRCDSVESVYCTLYIQKADENRACQPRWMKTKYLPPGCSHSWWRTGCKSMVACVVLCKWVSNYKQRIESPQRKSAFICRKGWSVTSRQQVQVSFTRALAQSRITEITHKPVARPADVRVQQRTEQYWLNWVSGFGKCRRAVHTLSGELGRVSMVVCAVPCEWVTTNNGSRVRSVSLPLFATKADLFPRGSRFKSHSHTHLLSHALQRSHIETHAQFTTRVWTARRHFPNPRTQLPWGGNARGWGQGQPQGSRWL